MYTQFAQNMLATFRSALALFVPVLLALGMLVAPARAQAQSLLPIVVCSGSSSATWSPGATNTTQTITVTTNEQWNVCALILQPPLLTSASTLNQFTANFSCQSILAPVPATWTITWANGATSTYAFTSRVNAVSNNLVITTTGTITAGLYAGDSAVATYVLDNLGATLANQCNTPGGVTGTTGITTLTISGL